MRERLESDLDVDNPVAGGSLTSKAAIETQMKSLLEKLEQVLHALAVLEDDDCTRAQALHAWRVPVAPTVRERGPRTTCASPTLTGRRDDLRLRAASKRLCRWAQSLSP